MEKITREVLLKRDYVEFTSSNRSFKNSEYLLQKPQTDIDGIRYFINFCFFQSKGTEDLEWKVDVQLKKNDSLFNIEISGQKMTVDEIEDFVYDVWDKHGFDYYKLEK